MFEEAVVLNLEKSKMFFAKLPESVQEYFMESLDDAIAYGFDWEHVDKYMLDTIYHDDIYLVQVIRWLPEFSLKIAVKAIKLFCMERHTLMKIPIIVRDDENGETKFVEGEHIAMLFAFLVAAIERRFGEGEGAALFSLRVPVYIKP